jgi:Ca2+-transporting ATPase
MNNFHAISISKVLKELGSSSSGLSKREAKARLKKYGHNQITDLGGTKWWHILLAQFSNIMVIILIIAATVSALVGEHIDAIAIGIIIVINSVIGFIQEYRAEKAVEALKKMAAPRAIAIRDNKTVEIDAKELVPGDIIVLEEGMNIPADARIIESAQMQSIEASLTGEGNSSPKNSELIKKFGSIGDLSNMVFMGTIISQGHGLGVVTATGMETEFGKIAHMVQNETDSPTPLQKQLNTLSKALAFLVLAISVMLFALAFFTGRDLIEMFMLSITLAVSVIPEGLPAVITLTLAIGVQRIAKKNAIIRKLPAAETLGSTSVICSDKTGTLTQNQMTVQAIYVNGNRMKVSGNGYKPEGTIEAQSSKELDIVLRTGALCNNARLFKSKNEWAISGDPTEACLLTLAAKSGLNLQDINKKWSREDELVFDSKRKRMSTLNKGIQHCKGAPDSIIKVCTHIQENGKRTKLTAAKRKAIMKENDALASSAFRVLAIAIKDHKSGPLKKEDGLTFVGLLGMIDPPRTEVKIAIETCHAAHIEVKMITGDHALTAKAIGESIGLYKKGDAIVTGEELEKMSDRELKKRVKEIRIFARVNPEHKVRILTALQKRGHIVAMTGDGVNDAPALKKADIGIAMGVTGTDVAKEASEMILTDDNFATIVTTIENGRVIYRNLKKFIRFSLSSNFDEVILITVTFLIGGASPFLPLQILWINLLTDSFPGLALGNDTPDEGIMKLKPRDPKRSIWSELIQFSTVASIISASAAIAIYFHFQAIGGVAHMQTGMFTFVIIVELFIAFSVRFGHKHFFTQFFSNLYLWLACIGAFILQLFAIYNPWLQEVLGTVPLDWNDWIWIGSLTILCIVILEIWKAFQKEVDHV